MASVYDAIDIEFAWNGDILPSGDGDIKDTSDDALQSLLDQVHLVCASSLLDWEIYPNKGAGLDDFVGEPNTRSTGDRVRDRVRIALTSSELVLDEDLQVRVVPVHIYKLLVIVRINATATVFNNLRPGDLLQTALVFDTLEHGVFFLDQVPELTA